MAAILLVGRARAITVNLLGQSASFFERCHGLCALLRWLNHYELLGCCVCCNCGTGLE